MSETNDTASCLLVTDGPMKRSPIHRKGERNALCPYYRQCLDEAVQNSWDYWDCSQCDHKRKRDPEMYELVMFDESDLPYDLPPEIHKTMS